MGERSEGWGFAEGEEIAPGVRALRRLGRGSRFETWLAIDDAILDVVVAKVVRPDRLGDAHVLCDLGREAGALGALAHPVVVRMLRSGLGCERPHLVLEHLEGPTLRRLVRRFGRLAPEQLVPLALHLCSALHYVGAAGWVHLDVKPDNVVMGAPPRLIDLSIACTLERAAALTEAIGTDLYMAPEQCAPGTGPIGPAADVWGLGVTLYEAATGANPFASVRREGERFPQLDYQPPPALGIPAPLTEAITACLAREPGARPAPLAIALTLEPVVAALPRLPVLLRRRPRIA